MNTSHTLRTALMAAALLCPVASQAIGWHEAQRNSCSPKPNGHQDQREDYELPRINRDFAAVALKPGQKRYRGSLKFDYVYGGDGNEKIFGMRSYDRLCGGAGDDILKGGALADHLDGGPGNDTLFAGPNRARDLINHDGVFGINGEILIGGYGDDVLISDNLPDMYLQMPLGFQEAQDENGVYGYYIPYMAGGGHDEIRGFEGWDMIPLRDANGDGAADSADVTLTDTPKGTLVSFVDDSGDTMLIRGIPVSALEFKDCMIDFQTPFPFYAIVRRGQFDGVSWPAKLPASGTPELTRIAERCLNARP